jgi:hypothetical protein
VTVDIDRLLVALHPLEHRIDHYEAAGATHASRAVHHNWAHIRSGACGRRGRTIGLDLLRIVEFDASNEHEKSGRVLGHTMIGPRRILKVLDLASRRTRVHHTTLLLLLLLLHLSVDVNRCDHKRAYGVRGQLLAVHECHLHDIVVDLGTLGRPVLVTLQAIALL